MYVRRSALLSVLGGGDVRVLGVVSKKPPWILRVDGAVLRGVAVPPNRSPRSKLRRDSGGALGIHTSRSSKISSSIIS